MISVKVKDEQAYLELLSLYSVPRNFSLQRVMRSILQRLMEEDNNIQIVFPREFLNPSYRENLSLFASLIKNHFSFYVYCWPHKSEKKMIVVRSSFLPNYRYFLQKVLATLQNPANRAIDIAKRDIPKSYAEQLFTLRYRIEKKVGQPITMIDLGDEVRFAKKKPDPKKKKRNIQQANLTDAKRKPIYHKV